MGPFSSIGAYNELPRIGELRMSPDGRRLVATVSSLDDDRAKRIEALWELDPEGRVPARRLTWSAKGETSPRWLADGSLLFLSARGKDDEQAPAALWVLPGAGGEARQLLDRPGGMATIEVARAAGVVVVSSPTLAASTDAAQDEKRRAERKDRKVSGVLHESSPIRYWDH